MPKNMGYAGKMKYGNKMKKSGGMKRGTGGSKMGGMSNYSGAHSGRSPVPTGMGMMKKKGMMPNGM